MGRDGECEMEEEKCIRKDGGEGMEMDLQTPPSTQVWRRCVVRPRRYFLLPGGQGIKISKIAKISIRASDL